MKTIKYNIDIRFDQILDLVKKLPKKEKLKLSRALEKDIVDTKLTYLLKAFKTNDLNQETIDQEVESVRSEIYAKAPKSSISTLLRLK